MKDFDEVYEVFEAMDADLSLIIAQKEPCAEGTLVYI
jgi:hypothetical protein